LLDRIIDFTHAEVMRVGGRTEYIIPCPGCGKQSTKRNIHFSFNERGGYCFVCGYKCGLTKLAEDVGMKDGASYEAKPYVEKPKRQTEIHDFDDLATVYHNAPMVYTKWNQYKPITMDLIYKYQLGVGVLPLSSCKHERLVMPIKYNGKVIGFRGRAIDCDCKKWMQSSGLTLDMLPLYNSEHIMPGDAVIIVENAIDAILVSTCSSFFGTGKCTGVATFSTSYWKDDWTKILVKAKPAGIVVAYDNDLPGNGGGANREKMIAERKKEHSDKVPQSRGILLVNKLIAAGLRAMLFWWGDSPAKSDIGELIKAKV